MSFLEGQLRNAIAKGFKGKLLSGILQRQTATTVNEFGNEVPGTPLSFTVEGFLDEYSDEYRIRAGIPEGDSKVVLILGNCQTDPKKDDLVSFTNRPAMKLRNVKIDPALAHAECQSFSVA